MRTGPHELTLLDANIIIHLLREDPTGKKIEAEHALATRRESQILSSIVEAEVLALARYREWSQTQIDKLQELLRALVRVDAGHPDVIQAYVDLYCAACRAGRYRQFRQNDLWIAATARAAGAVLYTLNGKDFDWIDENYIAVVHVSQAR